MQDARESPDSGHQTPTSPATSEDVVLGPVLHLGEHVMRAGTCSWTDRTLVKDSDWYPRKTMTAAERLGFYAAHFPLVEVDATYYAPPSEQTASLWAARSPEGFQFDVKAYSLLTGHPTRLQSLWSDLRDEVLPEHRDQERIYASHLELPEGMVSGYYKYIVFQPLERSTGKVYDEPCHRLMGHQVELPNSDWVADNHWCVPLYYRPAAIPALRAVSA